MRSTSPTTWPTRPRSGAPGWKACCSPSWRPIVVIVVMILLVVIPLGAAGDPGPVHPSAPTPDRQLVRQLARGRWASCCCSALLMLLYRVLPNIRLRATEVVPGAVVAWLLWLAAVWGYTHLPAHRAQLQHYLRQPGRDRRHAVLLLHLRLLFIFGAEVNSVLRRRHENRLRGASGAWCPFRRPGRHD